MADVGRPSQLDDEQFLLKIKDLLLDGNSEKNIAEILEIPIGTWDYWKWKNYQGFADKLLSYKHERIIRKAEANLEQLLEGDDDKIRADLTKFALEKLNKKHYSSKVEQEVNGTMQVAQITGMRIIKDGDSIQDKES